MMGTAKALRHVEQLARIVVARLEHSTLTGDCSAECDREIHCGKHHAGYVACEKCKAEVKYDFYCDNDVHCDAVCNADVSVDVDDTDAALLRDLRLALVQLDIARSENAPTVMT